MTQIRPTTPLLRLCRQPVLALQADACVRDAVRELVAAKVGALAVMEGDELLGIFTERDLLVRVIDRDHDPASLPLRDVMTRELRTIGSTATHEEAAELMIEAGCRHLPVMLPDGGLGGILSIRRLYGDQLRRLRNEHDSLQGYMLADGPGG
ncbi:MAG: cyclic nucleotide-binding/CBS domain-containing protein [Planctomycetota bacterium]